ncbi:MAG: tetratricopeptide repeat protein [Candidatus Omnitrophota bacterium]
MIDKDTGIFIAKIIAGVIALVVLFTVIIPRWQEIDKAFNDRMRGFINLMFDTGSSFKKSGTREENEYLTGDFNNEKNVFTKQFLNIRTGEEVERTLKSGQALLYMSPSKIEIARGVAFLYYISNDYEKADEYYQIVLADYPKQKRRFKYLKGDDSRTIKRALVELAALSYEQDDIAKMLDYYKQYLRASHRDDVFREMTARNIDAQTARYEIFNAIAGDGFLTYKKSIEQLEAFSRDFPEDKDVLYKLGLYNFDVVNLYEQDDFASIQQNFYDAGMYFYKVLDYSDDFRKKTILRNLEKLDQIKNKYDRQKAALQKTKERVK